MPKTHAGTVRRMTDGPIKALFAFLLAAFAALAFVAGKLLRHREVLLDIRRSLLRSLLELGVLGVLRLGAVELLTRHAFELLQCRLMLFLRLLEKLYAFGVCHRLLLLQHLAVVLDHVAGELLHFIRARLALRELAGLSFVSLYWASTDGAAANAADINRATVSFVRIG